jgi:hypothetical protein
MPILWSLDESVEAPETFLAVSPAYCAASCVPAYCSDDLAIRVQLFMRKRICP